MTVHPPTQPNDEAVQAVAAIIRRVDGAHELGAAALAEALVAEGVLPEARVRQQIADEIAEVRCIPAFPPDRFDDGFAHARDYFAARVVRGDQEAGK